MNYGVEDIIKRIENSYFIPSKNSFIKTEK